MYDLPPGTRHETKLIVDDRTAIRFLGLEGARVLATPYMIAWMEITARDAIKPLLPEGVDTVGTMVNIRHLAAAPIGVEVTFTASVREVRERRVLFDVRAEDAHGVVGEGTHERAIIDVLRFAEKMDGKRGQ